MFRKVLTASAVALGLFHAWLFAGQALQGDLTDPGRVARWIVALGLVASLVALARQRVSIFRSRRGIAIWVLAALLHAPVVTANFDGLEIPDASAVAITLTRAISAAAAALALALWLSVIAGRSCRPQRRLSLVSVPHSIRPRAIAARLVLAPRPPPPSRL